MQVQKAIKVQIYPQDSDTELLAKHFGARRFIYNAARNILRVGQIDCYGEEIKSQATGDLELKIPVALQKMTDKIESSGIYLPVSHGSGQAA